MTMSMTSPSSASEPLGTLIRYYPGNPWRFIWIVLWGALAAWTTVGSLVQGSVGGVLFGLALGAGCYAYYYYVARHDVHMRLFERGFVISRGGKTTSARWEDVANVEHAVRTLRYDFIIPIYRSHTYRITLTNGRRVKVTSSFRKHRELGDTIQRMWTEAAIDRRACAIAQQRLTE